MWNAGLDEEQVVFKMAGRNINTLRYTDDTSLMMKWIGTKEPFAEGERDSKKAGLKLNIQKTKIMASSPIASWQTDGEKWKQRLILFSWVPKSLQMVTAVTKLKDACSLEG